MVKYGFAQYNMYVDVRKNRGVKMSQMLEYKDKQLEMHVSNYRSAPMCMSIVGERVPARLFGFPMNVTTNLGENIAPGVYMPKYCAFVDVSRNDSKELLEFIEKNNLGKPYKRNGSVVTGRTGYTDYPVYQFNSEVLRQMDPEGCMKYEQAYSRASSIRLSTDRMRSFINDRNIDDSTIDNNDFGD